MANKRLLPVPITLAFLAVTGLAAIAVSGEAASHFSLEGLGLLAGDGKDPFGLVALDACAQPVLPRGGDLYWGEVELSPDRYRLLGVSRDELYEIDWAKGIAERVERIGYAQGRRTWFAGADPQNVECTCPTGPCHWYLRVTAELDAEEAEPILDQTIVRSGVLDACEPSTVLVDEVIGEPGVSSARLLATVGDEGSVVIELVEVEGAAWAFMRGMFGLVTPTAPADEPLHLPVTGLTFAPSGQMVVLSDAEWDPRGQASLYEIEIAGDAVVASFIAPVDADDVWAIEFADDGTLYGAGERLYTIDPVSGDATLLADLAPAMIVGLDYAPDGRLYGLEFDTNGAPGLHDLTPGAMQSVAFTSAGAGNLWGLAILDRDMADFNYDGLVNDLDVAIYESEYTGSMAGPCVPAGPGSPPLPAPLVVPLAPDLDDGGVLCNPSDSRCVQQYAELSMNALDRVFPGIVIDGSTTGLNDLSATIYVKHDNEWLHIALDVKDDVLYGYLDAVEVYLDSNNSDLTETEGDPFGFQARVDLQWDAGGDAGAMSAWEWDYWGTMHPGYRMSFKISKAETGMLTGGTYGFDLAIRDVDSWVSHEPHDSTDCFLFSQNTNGWRDETQWGDIYLAPGPLPGSVCDPDPAPWDTRTDMGTPLSWTPAPGATSYRVYLGADPDHLVFQGETTTTKHNPTLCKGSTYYWRVDAVNSNGARIGRTWAFTTRHSAADIDRDGDVDEYDLRRIVQRPAGDVTGDDDVNDEDLLRLLDALGSVVGDPLYDPAIDYDDDGRITEHDHAIWQCHHAAFWADHVGDFDLDGDVDLDDFARLRECLGGPVELIAPQCCDADLNHDSHVDVLDAAEFLAVFTGS